MNTDIPKSMVGPGGERRTWRTSLVNVREEHGGQDLSEWVKRDKESVLAVKRRT